MDFLLNIDLPKADALISHQHKILSIGSCFTEHIGNALQELKFNVLQNPNGILFDPASVCNSLLSYIRNEEYSENDLFYLNELWQLATPTSVKEALCNGILSTTSVFARR